MNDLVVRDLGLRPMPEVWGEMQAFTENRTPATPDEIWFVEHTPVFTLGLNADRLHLLAPGDIEVVETDRGGQVTYHGPGQLVCYAMLNLKRRNLHVRSLVETLESAVVDTVADYGIEAHPRREARGVYVDGMKLAAIGLRVRRGCSYHGLALNVAMDLEPFARINPCGFADLEVTQVSDLSDIDSLSRVRADLERTLRRHLEAGVS